VHQPERLKDPAAYAPLADAKPDLLVVAAYGLILPPPVLDLPRLGCVNIHASLLPRWRGAAPIQRAIEAGDRETGITLMRMEAGLDTGPMLLQESIAIAPTDNAADVHEKLASLGARLIVDGLRRFDSLLAVPQSADGVTYAAKIDKGEAPLDFRRPAVE
jgi:methionyl-tRNA formyltransferase